MKNNARISQRGFSMMEVLVSIFIVAVGLLGAAGMQLMAQQSMIEAQQRSQAGVILKAMAEQISAQPSMASCYVMTTDATTGTPFIGTNGAGYAAPALGCAFTGASADVALISLQKWSNVLKGNSEQTAGGAAVGAMEGGRGCISRTLDSTTDPSNPMYVYTVAVAWQGQYDLFTIPNPNDEPAISCAKGLYNPTASTGQTADTRRRVMWTTIRIANLSN